MATAQVAHFDLGKCALDGLDDKARIALALVVDV